MTKEEAAIIMAYTNVVIGDMKVFHKYVEKLLGRPVFTHEFSSIEITNEIKEKSKNDFINLHKKIMDGKY